MATDTDRSAPLGREVRRIREGLGWSRALLARKADVSEATVARLELYGQTPSVPTLNALAVALDADAAALMALAS